MGEEASSPGCSHESTLIWVPCARTIISCCTFLKAFWRHAQSTLPMAHSSSIKAILVDTIHYIRKFRVNNRRTLCHHDRGCASVGVDFSEEELDNPLCQCFDLLASSIICVSSTFMHDSSSMSKAAMRLPGCSLKSEASAPFPGRLIKTR